MKEGQKYIIVVGDGGRSGNTPQTEIVPYGFGGFGYCPSNVGGCTSAGCRNAPWENPSWGREVGDGGGLAGIFLNGVNKATAIAIAGGGGGGSDSSNGGSALNSASWDKKGAPMKGTRGSVRAGGGGGGYTGGQVGGQREVTGGTNYGDGLTKVIAKKDGIGSDHSAQRTSSGGADDADWVDRVGE